MQGQWIILIELLLVFGVVFGWGLNELRGLRRDRRDRDDSDAKKRSGR